VKNRAEVKLARWVIGPDAEGVSSPNSVRKQWFGRQARSQEARGPSIVVKFTFFKNPTLIDLFQSFFGCSWGWVVAC
jgi:hypothetical protein